MRTDSRQTPGVHSLLWKHSDSVSRGPSDLCLRCDHLHTSRPHQPEGLDKPHITASHMWIFFFFINSYWLDCCLRFATDVRCHFKNQMQNSSLKEFYYDVNSRLFKGRSQNNTRSVTLWQAEIRVCEMPCSFIRFLLRENSLIIKDSCTLSLAPLTTLKPEGWMRERGIRNRFIRPEKQAWLV